MRAYRSPIAMFYCFACVLLCYTFFVLVFESINRHHIHTTLGTTKPLPNEKFFEKSFTHAFSSNLVIGRVARWFLFRPKIPIWVYFGGSWNRKCYILVIWNILTNGYIYFMGINLFCSHLVYFSTGLVYRTNKNLATLVIGNHFIFSLIEGIRMNENLEKNHWVND
jgi:hypothetical protein